MKILRSLACLCFLLTACQSDSSSTPEEQEQTNNTQAESSSNEAQTAEAISFEKDGEAFIHNEAGEMYKSYVPESESADQDDYEQATELAISDYIEEVQTKGTEEWTAEQWATSLLNGLRANYDQAFSPVQDFKVTYESLKLPDGRLLQDVTEEELNNRPDKVNVAMLIDSSGSMKKEINSEKKMTAAKEAVQSFASELPEDVQASLYVFGHKGSEKEQDKDVSCKSIESVYPLSTYNNDTFTDSMDSFSAKGWTPLAGAIQQATSDLKENSTDETKNFIYIVSDGKETCGGNPVEAAKRATNQGMDVEVHIIGFQVDTEANQQLKEVAEAGGGAYTSVDNPQQLDEEVMKSWKETISKTTWRFWSAGNHNNLNWDSVGMSTDLRNLYANFQSVKDQEFWRINNTLDRLLEKEIITFEQKGEIQDLLKKRKEAITEYTSAIYDEKDKEIFDEADRLKEMIDKITEDLDL